MKKVLVAMAVMLATMMISCSNGDVLESVNEKYEKDGFDARFSQTEYRAIISYMTEYFETEDLDSADEQYPYRYDYSMILNYAVKNELLDDKTIAEYEHYEKIKNEMVEKVISDFLEEQTMIELEDID